MMPQDAMGFRTTYGFDSQSRLVTTMDARGGVVTNVYDTVGRLSIVKNQLGENVRQYGYDLAGRIVTQMDAANRCRTMTYDATGQNTVTQYPDGGVVTNAYDSLGRRTTMTDWGGVSTYTFDANNRMSSKTASGYTQDYGYDANGNRTTLTLSGVGTITSTYDTLNRLESARKPTGERYTMAYDNDSRRTTMQLGNGTTRQYVFDNNSRLTTQIELNGATKLCTIVDGYDSVGNRVTRNLDGTPTTWTYDDLYRLTGQNKSGQVCTYVMDSVGNLEVMWEGSSSSPKTFTFDAADKITTMAEGVNLTTYTWTGYGALDAEITGSRRTTYTYNGQDQLTKVQTSQMTSTYTFDGDGLRRTAQEGNVQPTTMVWDGSDYLFLDGPSTDQLVLTLDGEIVSCGTKDLLTDPLGSLVKEISSGASLGSLVEMYPYGSLVNGTGSPTIPYVYIAKYGYYNDSPARDYVRARALYKAMGRWMQVDPWYPEQPAVLYGANNPVSLIDPEGNVPFQDKWDWIVHGLPKNPKDFYSNPDIVRRNNCWNYACGYNNGPNPSPFPEFDSGGGMPGNEDCCQDKCSCKNLIQCVKAEVLTGGGEFLIRPPGKKCPKGTYTIIGFVRSTPPCDWHFIKILPDGRWCDKHGEAEVCLPFGDPYEHAKKVGYAPCVHFCKRFKR